MNLKSHKIPYRNTSPSRWWLASYIERFEFDDENKSNMKRRCLAYENTIIIKANNRDEAYRKAVKVGLIGNKSPGEIKETGRRGKWIFEGLSLLLPIYEDLEDGSEILWTEHFNKTVRKIKSLVRKKNELDVFNDDVEA